MRFIHTSDWHLGQTLHDFDRSHEHQCFLDWLLATLQSEQVDGLLIAGDVFDNANPSAASQKQLYRFLQQAKIALPHLNIVLIAGNHDSAGRLEAPGPLLEALDIAVIGQVPRLPDGEIMLERLVLPLKNKAGELKAWVLAIPFLRPGDVPRPSSNSDANSDTESAESAESTSAADPYAAGVALLYQQALELARKKRQPGQAILAMGHCHMVGGEISQDSERNLVIGGAQALPAGIFDPAISYAALGHLHLAQRVGKQAHLRYCGSPLPMSFSEINYPHQVLCVTLSGETVSEITSIPVPRTVDLLRIPPKPAPIDEVLNALRALDLPPNTTQQTWPYLQVRVRLDAPEPGLRIRIEAALEGKPVRLVKIEAGSALAAGGRAAPVSLDDLQQLQPEDIFQRLYRQRYENEVPAPQLAAFHQLLQMADDAGKDGNSDESIAQT
jgi:exonuclease SbcD